MTKTRVVLDTKLVARVRAAAVQLGRGDVVDMCNWAGRDATPIERINTMLADYAAEWGIQ
jgi:hypothetical protein